ncbi:MAG: hypothetical protein HUN04_03980 [Desulfobacter sp.]|nr:MAG: hypothetical protein HUN04_03980 [Desulfobacter sp.]
MKKLLVVSAGLMMLFFYGCNLGSRSVASSPGGVLDSAAGSADNHKIVTFYVTGKGLEPENALTKGEAVLMAERAAVADGYRQLVEKVRGVYVDAFMKAGRGTINHDAIQIHTQSWLRGTEIMEVTQGDYGITKARLRLRINFAKEGMIWWPVGIGDNVKPVVSGGNPITAGRS